MQRLRERCDEGQNALDVTQWFNWATFDIVGDLAFGEPFDCLEQASYHPWVSIIFESLVVMSKIGMLLRFGSVGKLLAMFIIPRSLAKSFDEHNGMSAMKVEKRLGLETERPDLIGKMVSGSQKLGAVSRVYLPLSSCPELAIPLTTLPLVIMMMRKKPRRLG